MDAGDGSHLARGGVVVVDHAVVAEELDDEEEAKSVIAGFAKLSDDLEDMNTRMLLSGKYDSKHPMPAGSARADAYNPVLDKLEVLNAALKKVADRYGVGTAQVPVAWAIAKGTLPIIGVTKQRHVEDAVKAAKITLTAEETAELEALADSLELNVIRFWEKEMK